MLVFLMLIGAAGFAVAADPSSEMPERFQPAPSYEGDRGRYTASLQGGWLTDGLPDHDPFALVWFEHAGSSRAVDAGGALVEAEVWRTEGLAYSRLPAASGTPTWFEYALEHWVEQTGDRVALRSSGQHTGLASEEQVPAVATQSRVSMTHMRWAYPDEAVRDCVLQGPVDGPIKTTSARALPTSCEITGLHIRLPAGAPMHAVGMREVDGVRTLAMRAAAEDVTITWYYAPGLPVPLRVDAEAPSIWADDVRSVRIDLHAFERGDGPTIPRSISGEAPATATAPRHVWGMHDDGIEHPFPVREAFRRASTDGQWGDLAAWRESHPDGYVFKTDFEERQTDDGPQYIWDIHMSDGREGFSFRATGTPPDPAVALVDPRMEITFETTRPQGDALAVAAPEPDRLPASLPTVESLWARWAYHASPALRDEGASLYTMRILADRDGEPVIHIAVGIASEAEWGEAGLRVAGEDVAESGRSSLASVLRLDASGQAMTYEEVDETTEQRSTILDTMPPVRRAQTDSVAQANTAPEAGGLWAAPDAVQSAGLGLFALAVGALYWAWPLLKSLPGFAMFSRIHGDELLEHRTRARIMEAVRHEPGIHFRALAARLGVNPGQVRHHVRKLVEGRHLVASKGSGYTCYYPYKGTSRRVMQAGPVLRAPSAQEILRALEARPGASGKDLAAAADLSPATTNYHLKRLAAAGLVSTQRDGRSLAVHLTGDGRQAVQTLVAVPA